MSRTAGALVAAAVVLGITIGTPGLVNAASINVSPGTVAPGGNVRLSGDVLAGVAGGVFWLATSIAIQTVYGERFATRFTGSRLDRLARRVTRS